MQNTANYHIPFNKCSTDEGAIDNFRFCLENHQYEKGHYSQQVIQSLKKITGAKEILLTHSCTAALEMSILLSDIKPGDEVIMPSFTFVSTANAVVLRGAKPVFVDLNPDTLNLDENQIEGKITGKTKAIIPVHYAGFSCDLDKVLDIANRHNLFIIEDAAQSIGARYKGKHLGTFSQLGAFSFHYTKNISAGFGGALLINQTNLIDKAKVIHQRGTNREAFLEGQVDKYTWVDLGSSFTMSELSAALLSSQIQNLSEINAKRMDLYNRYMDLLRDFENKGWVSLPKLPAYSQGNGHIFYFILDNKFNRADLLSFMRDKKIQLCSHFQPLHLSDFFSDRFDVESLPVTEYVAKQQVRLPLYPDLKYVEQDLIVEQLAHFFNGR